MVIDIFKCLIEQERQKLIALIHLAGTDASLAGDDAAIALMELGLTKVRAARTAALQDHSFPVMRDGAARAPESRCR